MSQSKGTIVADTIFKCKTCGLVCSGGSTLGRHYAEHPDHRPVGAPKGARTVTHRRKLTITDHIQAAVDKLAGEINEKRQMLADVERIKADITALENQRAALQKLLVPPKTI